MSTRNAIRHILLAIIHQSIKMIRNESFCFCLWMVCYVIEISRWLKWIWKRARFSLESLCDCISFLIHLHSVGHKRACYFSMKRFRDHGKSNNASQQHGIIFYVMLLSQHTWMRSTSRHLDWKLQSQILSSWIPSLLDQYTKPKSATQTQLLFLSKNPYHVTSSNKWTKWSLLKHHL